MDPINYLVNHLMLPILNAFHGLTGSYGWAIVLLTVTIKTLLLPLTMKSYYSMKEMQRLQPKFKQLQERHKGKPEELNKHMMRLYKEHKVNPLGGCLPMLIQMPFLIALYASLIGDKFKELLKATGDSSFFLVHDLARVGITAGNTLHIDNLVLVVLFGATTFWHQKIMTPQGGGGTAQAEAMQKQMTIMMPIMITAMFFIFPVPSGVFVYMVVSNLIGIGQYAYLNKVSAKMEARAAALAPAAPAQGNGNGTSAAVVEDDEDNETEPAHVSYASREKKQYARKKGHKKKKRRN